MIGVMVLWDCNLDDGVDACLPRYEFSQMYDERMPMEMPWNFRSVVFVSNNIALPASQPKGRYDL